MNNQITILNRSNQSVNVNLICYFSNNDKKYIFYDKNETVQDGLIKMYVSQENGEINTNINDNEWISLKKIMQDIITGNSSVQFLPYINSVMFNEPKVIALNDANLSKIKSEYNNVVNKNNEAPVLNKDILSQNFGGKESSETKLEETVQISSIPNTNNSFNMESIPVNMEMNNITSSLEPTIVNPIPEAQDIKGPDVHTEPSVNLDANVSSDVPKIEPIMENNSVLDLSGLNIGQIDEASLNQVSDIPSDLSVGNTLNQKDEIPTIEPINPVVESESLNINSVKPVGIDSGFKVSNEANIFDIPYNEEAKSLTENMASVSNEKVVNNSSLSKRIELNERKIKLFEDLANVFREENELLKEENDGDLEKTASNLFDNNGALNINEVLN